VKEIDTANIVKPIAESKSKRNIKFIIWYCAGTLSLIYINTQGHSSGRLGTIILGSLFFAWLIPLPHTLIALAFTKKRSWLSIIKIYEGWHKVLVAFSIVGFLAKIFNIYMGFSV
jgi:hypothetical protein